MRKRPTWIWILLMALSVIGCTPALQKNQVSGTDIAQPTVRPTQTPLITLPSEPASTLLEPTVELTRTDDSPPPPPMHQSVASLSGKRDAPVSGDYFHNDRVELIGQTGNPQLLEFYTEW